MVCIPLSSSFFKIMPSLFERVKNIFSQILSKIRKPRGFTGSPESLRIGMASKRNLSLGLPEIPVRTIMGDGYLTSQLIEMSIWNQEVRHSSSILARDVFIRENGEVRSWKVNPKMDDVKVDENLISVSKEIASRQFGKDLVLGGNALETGVRRMLKSGDSFAELGLNFDSKNKKDYFIEKIQYLPTFSVFVDVNDAGELDGTYSQRKMISKSPTDLVFPDWKILHFKYEELGASGRYGNPLFLQSVEAYEYLKEHRPDVAEAVRAAAISPWLHLMPENADEEYKEAYMLEHKSQLAQGLISNLYLLNKADVRKAYSNGNESLKGVFDYWMKLREELVPPGVPLWFFPGLGMESNSGKDIANQPALMYSRNIQALRGLVGTQVKWCISLEYCMKFGYESYYENVIKKGGFELDWGVWAVNGQEFLMKPQTENQSTQNQQLSTGAGKD